jgi:hypothetical protein
MINNIKGLSVVNYIGESKGLFQAVVKVPAGFMVAYEIGSDIPSLSTWKKGSLQTLQFKREGSAAWLTVFAKKGNKVIIIDQAIAETVTVGIVNSLFYNTNLMDQAQYRAVHAKTWADKVFVLNEEKDLSKKLQVK